MSRHVLEVLGPSTGGIRRHVAVLAAGLERRGWEVTVAGPAGVLDGLRTDLVAVPVALGPHALAAARALRPLVHDADVVHAHGLTAGWVAWAAGAGPKLVVTVHNLVLDGASGRTAPLLRVLEGRLPARARETIVISPQMRDHLAPHAPRPLHLVAPVGPTPVVRRTAAEVRAELGIGPDDPLVVLVGRLHPQKDVATLVEAATRLDPAVQVVVVGEGPQRGELEQLVRRHGLEARVHLVGEQADATDHQAAADVVVMCSVWEGFGLVVAEALALARPVVATAVGPVPEMVIDGETGRLVPPSDPEALAGAIADLLADPVRAAGLGRAGAKLVAPHFDTDALVRQVEEVYELVTEEPDR
ncbi:MAG: glycosyltransferase family 4 protein [Actinobacteria bacterium]|nr:glycosyltransferase family 4 protein [Actinomycetota bacterium]